jgi:probable rRNA maturation factor
MKYRVAVKNDSDWPGVEETLISAAVHTLEHQYAGQGSLTIVLTNREAIHELNRTFAGEDHPTDVLSFVDGTADPDGEGSYFGDIIIAADVAREQADDAGHALTAELVLLTVHGVLHLLGHDHHEEEEKRKMWSSQEAVLAALNVQLADGRTDR